MSQSGNPPGHPLCCPKKTQQWDNHKRINGSTGKTSIRSSCWGNKNNSGLEIEFKNSKNSPARELVRCLEGSYPWNTGSRKYLIQRTRTNDWKTSSFGYCSTINSPFNEQSEVIAQKISKQEKDKPEYQCDWRPEINVVFIGGSTHWGWYEPFGLQKTNKSL